MVDQISGNTNNAIHKVLQDNLTATQTGTTEAVRHGDQVLRAQAPTSAPGEVRDSGDISPQAKRLYEADKFGQLIQKLPISPEDVARQDKVAAMKAMVSSGRTDELLANYETTQLAEDLLQSPVGRYLSSR